MDGCSAAHDLRFFRQYKKTFSLSKNNKTPPYKKSRPSRESKVQTPSAPGDRQATKGSSKQGRVRDLKNLKMEDVTRLHTTHPIRAN